MLTLTEAAVLDATHPRLTDHFNLPDDVIYMDGNSLGALPDTVAGRLAEVVEDEWGKGLIRSWNDADWIGLPNKVANKLARLIGAPSGTVTVSDSTSVNLYKAVSAAMDIATGPQVLLTDTANFPSDRYVLASLAERWGWGLSVVDPSELVTALDSGVGVLAVTQVDYRTGSKLDMGVLNAAARNRAVVTVWDLAHSAGAFRVDLEGTGADFAVGCGYKFLNGGPGAPGFLFAAQRHHEVMSNPITGWFSHAHPFDFSPDFAPAAGIGRMRVGTAHVLSLVSLDAAIDVFGEVGLDALWQRGADLTQYLIDGLTSLGLDVVTPTDPNQRGSQASFRHPHAYAIVQLLIDRGVIGDFRTPDIARFGVAPLYLTYTDIAGTLEHVAGVVGRDDLDSHAARRGEVI